MSISLWISWVFGVHTCGEIRVAENSAGVCRKFGRPLPLLNDYSPTCSAFWWSKNKIVLAPTRCKFWTSQVYDELEEITGYNRNTIKKFKYVADSTAEIREDESLLRSKDIKFSHFETIASLPTDQQKEFLNTRNSGYFQKWFKPTL